MKNCLSTFIWTTSSHSTVDFQVFLCRMCKSFNDEEEIKSLHYVFIYSKLDFANITWNPSYTINKFRLDGIQNKFVRFLL